MALKPTKFPTFQPDTSIQEVLTGTRVGSFEDEKLRQQQRMDEAAAGQNSFQRGLEQGAAGTMEAVHGSMAIKNALMGDTQGAEEAAAVAQEYADSGQRFAPEVGSLADVDDIGDAGSWAAGALGQLAPSLATIIAGTAIGARTGGVVGAIGGTGLGVTMASATGRSLAKKLLQNYLRKQAKKQGREALTKGNAAAVGAQRGAQFGGITTGSALEGGQLGSELLDPDFNATSVFGRELSQREKALIAVAGGAAAGRLEALPVFGFFKRHGLGKTMGEAVKNNLGSELGKQALQEGSTEAAQQLIQRAAMAVADQNRDVIGEDGVQELIDSFAAGALGGGVFAAGGRALTPDLARGGDSPPLPTKPPRLGGPDTPNTDLQDYAQPPGTPGAGEAWTVDADGNIVGNAEDLGSRPFTFADRMNEFVESLSPRDQELDVDGFSVEDIASEVFGEQQDPGAYQDTLAEYAEFKDNEAPPKTKFDDIQAESAGAVDTDAILDADRVQGMQLGAVTPDYQYQKTTYDSKGQPLRQEPYVQGSKTVTDKLEKLGEGHEEVSLDRVTKERARAEFPGDPQAQRDHIARQAQVVSNGRNKADQKIQPGQTAEEYLGQFSAIRGPDREDNQGTGVLGKVRGDLTITPEELKRPYGEIKDTKGKLANPPYKKDKMGKVVKGADGKPVVNPVELRKERTRRQVVRSMNEDTFNTGFNKDKDLRVAGNKVVNAVSLSIAMQPKMNETQSDRNLSLPAKAGEWFTAGVASLNENGVKLDLAKVPDSTVIYNNITWGQAKEAMKTKTADDAGRTPAVQRLDRLNKQLRVREGQAPLNTAEAGSLAQAVADAIGKTVDPKRFIGKPIKDVRNMLNKLVVAERKASQPPRDTDRDTTATITRRARPTAAQMKKAKRREDGTTEVPLGRKVADKVVNTGQDKPGTPQNEPELQRPIRRTGRGVASEVLMEERDGKLQSTADLKPENVITRARTGIQRVNAALKQLASVKETSRKGRLERTPALHKALQQAGLVFEPADIFDIPAIAKTRPPKGASVRGMLRARLNQHKEALIRQGLAAKAEIDRRGVEGKPLEDRPSTAAQDKAALELRKDHIKLAGTTALTPAEKALAKDAEAIREKLAGAKELTDKQSQEQEAKAAAEFWAAQAGKTAAEQHAALAKRQAEFLAENRRKRREAAEESLWREVYEDAVPPNLRNEDIRYPGDQRLDDQDISDAKGNRKQPNDFYRTWYEDPKSTLAKEAGLLDALMAVLGIKGKVRMATPEDLALVMAAHPEWGVKVLKGSIAGSKLRMPDGTYAIYLNPRLTRQSQRYAVLAHEIGHVVFAERFQNANKQTKEAIVAAYQKWREAQEGKGDTTKGEVNRSKRALPIIEITFGDDVLISELSEADRRYLLDFEEWFADQTARYMTSAEAPKSVLGKFFKGVAFYLKKIYSEMKADGFLPDQSIKDFYDAILTPQNDVKAQVEDALFDVIRQSNESITDPQMIKDIARLARAAFRAENRNAHSEADLAMFAATIAQMAGRDGSNMNYATFRLAYDNLLNTRERQQASRAFGTKTMQNRIRAMLLRDGNIHGAREVMHDPDALVAYGYQYWKAGQLSLGPKTTNIFQRLVERIRKILGVVGNNERAEKIFRAVDSNAALLRKELGETDWRFSSPGQRVNTTLQQGVAAMRELGQFAAPIFSSVFDAAYTRMARSKNPWLMKLATEFYVPPNSQGRKQGYFEAKNLKLAEYHNRAAKILQGRDAAFKAKVAKGMTSGKLSEDPEVADVQRQLRDTMEELRNYALDAGVDLGKRSDAESGYWPWVFDNESMLADADTFRDMLIKTMPASFVRGQIKGFRGKRWVEVQEGGENVPVTPAMRAEVAQRVYDSILHSKGYADGASINDYELANHTPYMASHDTRVLDFIKQDSRYSAFLSQDIDKTLISYIDQTVRRAEFARRFGDDGNGRYDPINKRHVPGISEILDNARKAGMNAQEQDSAEKYIKAMLGTLGGDINPTLRKSMSYVMMYENLRILSMAVFSSLVDPLGILARTGSLQDSYVALQVGIKDLAGMMKRKKGEGGKSEARLLAETLGIIEDSIAKEALGYEYGGAYMSGFAKQVNEGWFELTGIAGYTRMTRVMATGAAQSFLKRHKAGLDKDSARYLDELGVTARDIQLDENGQIKILTEGQRAGATAKELARDDRVRGAIFRFVDEAILRPDSAQRPIYGSDPHFMLVFHLKGFMYSFYERIMKRAWTEAVDHGRVAPIASLGLYVPGMIAADMARDALKDAFGDQDDDRRDDWTAGDWIEHGVDRSGLYGPYVDQMNNNVEDYTKYRRMPGMDMFGPAAKHAVDILGMKGGLEAQLTRALPAQNLLRPMGESLMSNFEG